ncbi:hypothetical protein P22_0131 [Propionispora sp. 2/2-37]|uniref:SMC-Scp complex subunit ScpB n=1 Tax=Propionispora sp. 2/2-37 TaxID=1677858 RepID=UPI0006BB8388|nr:SMC-Scp complex subunit ScpB [Propionispora sp. 2/2-37]CUH94069.1 hypothetical protein P22_0131 [Propionispora sp. 2/2-37]
MFYTHLQGHIEAILFVSGDPVPVVKLSSLLDIPEQQVELLIAQMNEAMLEDSRGLVITKVANGYQLCTKPEIAPVLEKLGHIQETKLSMAAMETLAIIAFKQPITKQEIESIRGVKVEGVVNMLVERRLVREVGRKEAIGRPILYGTTEEFLTCFGLNSLDRLPDLAEFVALEQS